MATELRITVATHGAVWSENMNDTIQQLKAKSREKHLQDANQQNHLDKTKSEKREKVESGPENVEDKRATVDFDDAVTSKKFDEAFEELFDPLIPVRGHALLALAKLLQAHDAKAMQKSESLLKIFEENVSHDDSYIYLAAIKVWMRSTKNVQT